MAASSRDKDFVHRLLDRIATTTGAEPRMIARNIADFEIGLSAFNIRENLKDELASKPDVIILAIGENASSPTTDESRTQFTTALAGLLAELKQSRQPQTTIIVRSLFLQDAEKDKLIKRVCINAEVIFIDISTLGVEEANCARSERQIPSYVLQNHILFQDNYLAGVEREVSELCKYRWHKAEGFQYVTMATRLADADQFILIVE